MGRALTSAPGVTEWKTFQHSDNTPAMSQSTPDTTTLRKWMCVVCGFIYDEAMGLPEEGLEPGTRWEDIPDTWTCPDCGVTKDDFEMVEMD